MSFAEQNLMPLVKEPPLVTSGEVIVQVEPGQPGGRPAAGATAGTEATAH